LETRPFLVKGDREGAAGCHICPCHRCRQKFEVQPTPDAQANPEKHNNAGDDDDTDSALDGDATDFGPGLSPGLGLGSDAAGLGLDEDEGQSRRAPGTTVLQPTASVPPKVSYNVPLPSSRQY
jgi:hypothetical protein